MQLVVEDRGPGIDFGSLPKATLTAYYSSKCSLGLGFTVMLEAADRILLSTRPGHTIVVLEAWQRQGQTSIKEGNAA